MRTLSIRRLQPIAIVTLRAVLYAAKPSSGWAVESSNGSSLDCAVVRLTGLSLVDSSVVARVDVAGSRWMNRGGTYDASSNLFFYAHFLFPNYFILLLYHFDLTYLKIHKLEYITKSTKKNEKENYNRKRKI